jgi:bla regulator protein blaR1
MNGYLNYLLEANLCLLFFYGAYRALFERGTAFGFNRMYLLGAIVLSLIFPLVEIGGNTTIPGIGSYLRAHFLPTIVIGGAMTAEVTTAGSLSIWQIALWIYGFGVLFMTARFLYLLYRVSALIHSCSSFRTVDGIPVRVAEGSMPTFSIFETIILGSVKGLSESEQDQIIRHEAVHVRKGHTWDMLLAEGLCIAFWFNPVTVLIKKKLKEVHEFQADEKATEGRDIQQYCRLLARISLVSAGFSLANHFNKSLIVKRINMMKTMKKRITRWKVAALLLVTVGIFVFVACQDQVLSEINDIAGSSTMAP